MAFGYFSSSYTQMFLAKVHPNGKTYEGAGYINGLRHFNADSNDKANGFVFLPDGKYIACGRANDQYFMLRRFFQDGAVDTTFGNHGITRVFTKALSEGYDVIQQPDGKLLAGGFYFNPDTLVYALARVLPDGRLDSLGFGTNGIVRTDITEDTTDLDIITDLDLLPDGKILATGRNAVVLYHTDGSIDTTFADHGLLKKRSYSAVIQQDGKMVITQLIDSIGWSIARYFPNGAIDTTFAFSMASLFYEGIAYRFSNDMILQNDGKLLVGFSHSSYNRDTVGVIRFLTSLTLQATDFKPQSTPPFIYPNPIHDQTTITFETTQTGPVNIRLFDLQGKWVADLLEESVVPPGKFTRNIFLPPNIPHANYLISVNTHAGAATVKILKI
jgi:uncharacterized delta-60 repeat protein